MTALASMLTGVRAWCTAVSLLMAAHSAVWAEGQADSDSSLAIKNVTVISMADADVHRGQTVVVQDGRIAEIGPSEQVRPPSGAIVVDGTGRYLIPGLADMHAHVYSDSELLLYVAHGVTRIRNMWGSHTSLAMRARSDSGVITAPRILTAGRLVDGSPPLWGETSASVTDPETARVIMDEEQEAGFDFLKVYETLSAETFDAIAAHAADIGHPFGGHVPRSVPLERALRSGMHTIEHNSGWGPATRVYRPRGPDEGREVLQGIARGDTGWERLFDLDRTRELAELAAESGVWHVPTLSWYAGAYVSRRQAQDRFARAGMESMSPRVLAAWDPAANPGLQSLSDETLEAFQTLLAIEQIRTKALHDAGAPLLLGTDAPNPFVPTGAAVHEELALLVEAGLTPFEALQTATSAVADFLGDSTVGTIAPGHLADLVLIDGNPLENISATREIAGVVLRGRWLARDTLDSLLQRAVASYDAPDEWSGDAAPTDGADANRYTIKFDSLEIGAEWVDEHRTPDTVATEGRRTTLTITGGLVTESVRIEETADGAFLGLTYQQTTTSGSAEVRARREGDRVSVLGRTVDGQPTEQFVVLEKGTFVTAPLVAGLGALLAEIQDMAVGERRTLGVWTLNAVTGSHGHPSGNPRLVAETWDVSRRADSSGACAFEATVERLGVQWTLTLRLDASGLVHLSRPDGPRRYIVDRQ